jgi:hypothetical protein
MEMTRASKRCGEKLDKVKKNRGGEGERGRGRGRGGDRGSERGNRSKTGSAVAAEDIEPFRVRNEAMACPECGKCLYVCLCMSVSFSVYVSVSVSVSRAR